MVLATASALVEQASAGEMFVVGNTETGHIVIRGNSADASTQVHHEAKGIRDTGWVQILADDASGWGAVSCVAQGSRYHFFLANGHKAEADAAMLARAAADKFLKANGGRLVFLCAPRWNNHGQPMAFGGGGHGSPADPPERKPTIPDVLIGVPQGMIRDTVRKDYRRDCLPPAEAARAEIAPSTPGTVRTPDKRQAAGSWKPADWCPPSRMSATGKRG